MASIKSYTDLEQSKKLAEILALESADMHYSKHSLENYYSPIPLIGKYSNMQNEIPCWSLAALIDIIESIEQKVTVSFTHCNDKFWVDVHFSEFGSFCQDYELYDSKIDSLIAIIEKLKSRNLL